MQVRILVSVDLSHLPHWLTRLWRAYRCGLSSRLVARTESLQPLMPATRIQFTFRKNIFDGYRNIGPSLIELILGSTNGNDTEKLSTHDRQTAFWLDREGSLTTLQLARLLWLALPPGIPSSIRHNALTKRRTSEGGFVPNSWQTRRACLRVFIDRFDALEICLMVISTCSRCSGLRMYSSRSFSIACSTAGPSSLFTAITNNLLRF